MFFEVSSTKNSKKIIFSSIKNKMTTLSQKERISSPAYYVISNYLIYLFEKEQIDLKNKDFVYLFKIVKFIKNNFVKHDKFIVFFEKDGKLNAFIKDKEKVSLDSDHGLEMAPLLLFYETYFEENVFFYLSSSKLEDIVSSLINIYELSDNIFTPISEEITEADIKQIEENIQITDNIMKIFEKMKEDKKKKELSAEKKEKKSLDLSKLKKYIKPFIYLSILGGISYGGYYYMDMKEKEKIAAEREAASKKKVKKVIDLTIANKNYSKTESIRKYLNMEGASIITAKGETITALLPTPNEKEKDPYKYVFKISENQFYIEGKVTLEKKIVNIKDLNPINFNLLFNEFNRKGYKQENFMILSTEANKEELNRLLDLLSRDNIYSFDMFIKYNLIDRNYSINMNIYKAKKEQKEDDKIKDFRKKMTKSKEKEE